MPILIRNGRVLIDTVNNNNVALNISSGTTGLLEAKTVQSTTSTQTIYPSTGYSGFSVITVNPIPNSYIQPSGTLTITSNDTYNVTNYASAIVNVPTGTTINNQNKTVNPSSTSQSISFDSGYTGLGTIIINPVTHTGVASKIASGQTLLIGYSADNDAIASISGTYTSDANAIAANLLYNKTAYVNGNKITGSMPNNGALNSTINSQGGTYSIPAGYTTGGTITAYLTPSSLSNSIINGSAYEEETGDYAFRVSLTIPTGYHSETTLTKDFSSILPAPETEGTSTQVLVGYDLYNHEGKLISGSMTNNGTWNRTLTDTTTSVTIPAGYHSGSGTVSHTTVNIPDPTISVNSSTGVITASGSWTKGFTIDNSYSKTYSLNTKAATTYTPTTTNQTIAAGTYLTGIQTISGDANLIAENIKNGVPIFGVTGNYSGSATNNQNKTVTPTESLQSITADSGYTGLGTVTVEAISSTYVGSGITSRSSTDLSASGATVTVPAGYYSAQATKSVTTMTLPTAATSSATSGYTSKATISRSTSDQYINIPPGYNSAGGYYKISAVANGSVTAPATISGTSATLSTGTGTLTLTKTVSVTPSVTTAGYISSGTAGNSTVSLTASVNIGSNSTLSFADGVVSAAAGYYPAQADYTLSTTSVSQGTTTVSGTTATRGTATWGSGYITSGSISAATFSNTATSGVTYVNISDTTAAPVLVSNGFLYINKGYTDNLRISLAKLVPDGASAALADNHILSGYSAYNNDGILVAGNIPTKTSTDITVSGATVTIPAGYYASQNTKSVSSMTLPTAASSTSSGTLKATIGRSTSNQYINIPVGYNSTAAYYTISAVANGSATGPSSLSGTSATVSTGTNTLTLTKTGVTTTPTVSAGYVSSATASTATVTLTANVTTKAAATYYPSASDQTISASQYLTGAQTIKGVTTTNLIAANIKKNVVIEIGDTNDSDRILSITGSYEGSGGESSLQVGTATTTPSSASSSISFTGLSGEPTSFVVTSMSDLATGASPWKTASVVYDGTNVIGQVITNTNNAQVTYDSSGFSKSYSNGTLTITGTSTNFQANQYKLVYTYGGSSGNIGTDDVQVGSGATSITFTGLSDEPSYFSCIFKSNFSTSSGYQRVITVVYDGTSTYGLAMDSGAKAATNWSYTYNNGSLTLSSSGTNAGGYFHQPGYYQLTYATGEVIELTAEPLSVTENGTYTAPKGKAYTPVTVSVSGSGSSKNVQIAQNTSRTTATSLTAVGPEITVSKTGTYDVYWSGARTNTSSSYTWGTQLYIGSSAYGTENTTWSNNVQNNHLTNVSLTANQKIRVYGRGRGSNYYLCAPTLVIIEA